MAVAWLPTTGHLCILRDCAKPHHLISPISSTPSLQAKLFLRNACTRQHTGGSQHLPCLLLPQVLHDCGVPCHMLPHVHQR